MKNSVKKGIGFGLPSGIITTLGLIVGLNSSTHSKIIVIGGIIIIAIADALSDALGMHISQETEIKNSTKQIWECTFATFLSKLVIALTFIIPILLLELKEAIVVSIFWGLFLITLFSYYLADKEKVKPYKVILEHLIIAVAVIILTNYLGKLISVLGI